MRQEYTIRKATPEDAAGVFEVLSPIVRTGMYSAIDPDLTVEQERDFIQSIHPRGWMIVAEDAESRRILGFHTLEPFAAYSKVFDHVAIVGTYVELNQHRRGVGRALCAESFERAREAGFEKVFTYVRADNPRGLAFYEEMGFRVVGIAERQVKVNQAYVDEVIIERFL